jgi:hypothetical protein
VQVAEWERNGENRKFMEGLLLRRGNSVVLISRNVKFLSVRDGENGERRPVHAGVQRSHCVVSDRFGEAEGSVNHFGS